MRRLRHLCAGLALAALSGSLCGLAEAAPRTWTAGRAKVTGEFVSMDKDKSGRDVVTIRQANGKEVEVLLQKLDPVDQAYARKAAEDAEGNPFKEKGSDDSPFKEKDPGGEPMADGGDAPVVKARTVTVDWNSAQAVDPQPEAEAWAGAVKPEQLVEGAPQLKPKTIRLPNRRDFFEKPTDVLFSPAGEKAAVGYTLQKPGSQDASTRIALFDLKTGKSLGSGETEGEYLALGVENDGRRMLVRKSKFGFGENDQLEVWTLGKSGIQRGLQWKPHDQEQGPRRDVKWGAVVSDGKALTLAASGRFALWDLETGEPVWYLDAPREHEPALSPNHKYLAYEAQEAIGLLDVAAGKVLALLPTEQLMLSSLAFSPDGKYLAASSPDTLWVWDVATGDLYREVNIRNQGGFRSIVWADPQNVLLGSSFLINVENRVPLWQYTGASSAKAEGGVVWFYVSAHNSGEAVVGANLPHAGAEQALKTAMGDPNFFLLKPGSQVSLDLSGIPDPDRGRVATALQKSVTDAGFKVANGAPIVVKATMSRGEEREISYHTFGSFRDEKYKVREYVLELSFIADGRAAWQTKTVNLPAPFFVSLKQGQTMADLLKEHDKPGYEFFERLRLPKFVPRLSDRPALGTSAVALQGVR